MKKFFLAFALTSATAFAGVETGGGGDVVILPDGKVRLADPFMDHGAPQPNNMPPMRALNPRLLQAVNLYTKAIEPFLKDMSEKSDIHKELEKLKTRASKLRFYAVRNVAELNQFCAPGGRKNYVVDSKTKVEQAACTAGSETFLVEPTFMQLSLKDQALLLIHERLTTLRDQFGGKNYSAIARFTTGLGIYLDLYREQSLNKMRALTPQETELLTQLFVATEELEKRNSEVSDDSFQWVAHSNGGGRVHAQSLVDETAYVGLSTVLGKGSRVGAKTLIINSKVSGGKNINIGENVTIKNVTLTSKDLLDLKDRSKIENSVLKSASIELNSHTQIKNSELHSDKIRILENCIIENSNSKSKNMALSANIQIKKSSLNSDVINIAENVIINTSALGSENLQLQANTKIENSRFITNELKIAENSVVIDSYAYTHVFAVHANSTATKGSFIADSVVLIGADSKIENLKVNLTARYSSLTLAPKQEVNGGVYNDTSLEYHPISVQVSPIRLAATTDMIFDYTTNEENVSPVGKRKELPVPFAGQNVMVNFKADVSYDGYRWEGSFSYGHRKAYKYVVKNVAIDIAAQPILNTDKNLLSVTSNGFLQQAGHSKSIRLQASPDIPSGYSHEYYRRSYESFLDAFKKAAVNHKHDIITSSRLTEIVIQFPTQ